MTPSHQTLVKQITDEAQALPENLVREVLDFIGFLRLKYEPPQAQNRRADLLATFGSWQDDRAPEEIIEDIYATRTISEPGSNLQ